MIILKSLTLTSLWVLNWLFALYFDTAFAKTSLDVKLLSAGFEQTNPEYVGPGAVCHVARKNRRGAPCLNALFPFIRDLPLNVNSSWQVFERGNNAWRPTVMKGSFKLCDVLGATNKFQKPMLDATNFPKKCPIKKGNYTITDYCANSADQLPPLFPAAEFKSRAVWGTPQTNILTFFMVFKVDRKGTQSGSEAGSAYQMAEIYGSTAMTRR